MSSDMDHGRKISQREYERAVVELYTREESRNLDKEALQRKELNLTIDYRLGVDFPSNRREALWKVQQEIERKRLRMLVKSMLVKIVPILAKYRSKSLASFVLEEYAKVLSPEEMKAYFE